MKDNKITLGVNVAMQKAFKIYENKEGWLQGIESGTNQQETIYIIIKIVTKILNIEILDIKKKIKLKGI